MLRRTFTSGVSGFGLLAVLSACSGGGNSAPSTPLSPAVERPQAVRIAEPDAAAKASLIVSDAGTNTVDVFSTTGKLLATITGLSEPQGLSSDSAGDVYIANTAGSNVPVYKSDDKTLKSTLSDPNEYPADVDVSTAGVVGVTNLISTSGGSGSVSFYAKDTTTPCVTVASSAWTRIYFGAFDRAGNFYIDGENSSGSVLLGIVSGGCAATSITTLKTTISIQVPGAVAVTPADKLVVSDGTIFTFDLPQKGVLGPPIAKTKIKGAGAASAIAFTASGNDLWTISSQALEYAYPTGGSPVKHVALAGLLQPIGLLVTPFAQP